jgi:hypothetical protein
MDIRILKPVFIKKKFFFWKQKFCSLFRFIFKYAEIFIDSIFKNSKFIKLSKQLIILCQINHYLLISH